MRIHFFTAPFFFIGGNRCSREGDGGLETADRIPLLTMTFWGAFSVLPPPPDPSWTRWGDGSGERGGGVSHPGGQIDEIGRAHV